MKKYALITGASRGIGKATALQLAKDGFVIFLNYLSNDAKGNEVISEIKKDGGEAYAVKGDVSKEKEVEKIAEKIESITDKLDLLINNAGLDLGKMIEDFTIDEMRKIIEVDLIGVFITTKIMLRLLKKSPSPAIINIASRMGQEKTIETIGAYGPAKAGVIKFTKCCALEFTKYKIRVNAVLPGLTDTDMNRSLYPEEEFWQKMAKINPRGRVGHPQDIANVISFLTSDKAEYINGETIGVNGGSNLL